MDLLDKLNIECA